jgi:hypothetical protein
MEKGRVQRPAGQPAVTPDMLWPTPRRARARPQDRSLRISRTNHPSVGASIPEPTLILGRGYDLVDLSECGNGCGEGVWCEACQADIRAEALHWLRELNVPRPAATAQVLAWTRAWHREIHLADH